GRSPNPPRYCEERCGFSDKLRLTEERQHVAAVVRQVGKRVDVLVLAPGRPLRELVEQCHLRAAAHRSRDPVEDGIAPPSSQAPEHRRGALSPERGEATCFALEGGEGASEPGKVVPVRDSHERRSKSMSPHGPRGRWPARP